MGQQRALKCCYWWIFWTKKLWKIKTELKTMYFLLCLLVWNAKPKEWTIHIGRCRVKRTIKKKSIGFSAVAHRTYKHSETEHKPKSRTMRWKCSFLSECYERKGKNASLCKKERKIITSIKCKKCLFVYREHKTKQSEKAEERIARTNGAKQEEVS